MSNTQGGYNMVDADDEVAGDIGNQPDNPLKFQSFLGTQSGGLDSGRHSPMPRDPPTVPYSPFNLTYYQSYFDVDTKTILDRCLRSCLPKEGFVNEVCEERMDLYGPFWSLTTLILTTFLSTSLLSSLTHYLSDSTSTVKVDVTLLSLATTLIYLYGLLFPCLFWGATRWFAKADNETGGNGGGEWSVVEAVGVWGYAMVVFVPVSILCAIPVPSNIYRWVLVGAAGLSSGLFLVRNIYPVLAASADNKLQRLLILVVVFVHAAVVLSMKILFFSYTVTKSTGGSGESPTGEKMGEEIGEVPASIIDIVDNVNLRLGLL